jgi:hypothetical protein
MVYHGHIENGAIKLDGAPTLPDGAEVELHLISEASEKAKEPDQATKKEPPWFKYIGAIKDMPPDASQKIDEVLYGHCKE